MFQEMDPPMTTCLTLQVAEGAWTRSLASGAWTRVISGGVAGWLVPICNMLRHEVGCTVWGTQTCAGTWWYGMRPCGGADQPLQVV